jgi:hypothetical protein
MIPSAAPSTLTDLDQPFFAALLPRKLVGSRGAAIVAGLRLPVFARGGAGSANEEASRPTMWPCVRCCQRQPLGCLSLPVAPHRATGSLPHLSLPLPDRPLFLTVPSLGATLPTSRLGSPQIP